MIEKLANRFPYSYRQLIALHRRLLFIYYPSTAIKKLEIIVEDAHELGITLDESFKIQFIIDFTF